MINSDCEIHLTIKDIARLSGCAVSTVSRALNDHPDVNAETRERICRIVKENNYCPNRNAKLLKQTSGKTVLLIVKGSANLFFTPILEQIQSSAGKKGISVTVSYISENDNEVSEALHLCEEMKPIGIIFLGGNICIFQRDFERLHIPCVLCTAYAGKPGFANLSSVSVNDFLGGRAAALKLCELGHRRIGILSGDYKSEGPFCERFRGICDTMSEYGVTAVEKVTEICEFPFRSAYEKAWKLVSEHSDITAVIAMSDIMAIGAVRAFGDMKLKIPDDISVIGFDGLELADFYTPRITTFHQPVDKLAEITVKMLIDMIPKALDESAYLDGATKAQVFFKITLPLSKPIIVYTILTSFMAPWVDYIFPSIICGSNYDSYTVALGMFKMLEREFIGAYYTQFAAGAVLVSIPIAALFISMQKYYVEGVTGGAVKG